MKVLLISDDLEKLLRVSEELEGLGLWVLMAQTQEEAHEQQEVVNFDFILRVAS